MKGNEVLVFNTSFRTCRVKERIQHIQNKAIACNSSCKKQYKYKNMIFDKGHIIGSKRFSPQQINETEPKIWYKPWDLLILQRKMT